MRFPNATMGAGMKFEYAEFRRNQRFGGRPELSGPLGGTRVSAAERYENATLHYPGPSSCLRIAGDNHCLAAQRALFSNQCFSPCPRT